MTATGSGNFVGHAVPAAFFGCFGVFFLLLTLKRSRELSVSVVRQSQQSFSTLFVHYHIPERNTRLLSTVGWIVTLSAVAGILLEGLGGCFTSYGDYQWEGCFFYQSAHEILYTVYGSIGVSMLFEARARVPRDTSRCILALASLLAYVLWHTHAVMKQDMVDRTVHELMALSCLIHSILTVASVGVAAMTPATSIQQSATNAESQQSHARQQQQQSSSNMHSLSLILYISGWASMVQQACWLLTAGYNTLVAISMHAVAPLFCLQVMLVVMSIVIVGALYGQQRRGGGPGRGTSSTTAVEYEQLKIPTTHEYHDDHHDDLENDNDLQGTIGNHGRKDPHVVELV